MTVSFAAATYSVDETGTDATTRIVVRLSAAPERGIRIPLTATLLGNASMDDFTAPLAVQFLDGETETFINFSAEPDTDEDHGESVRLGFGTPLPERVTASGTTTTTVTIIDDDPAVTVTFGALADLDYTIAEGEQVVVPVELSAAPQRPLSIPITFSYMGSATAGTTTCAPAPQWSSRRRKPRAT